MLCKVERKKRPGDVLHPDLSKPTLMTKFMIPDLMVFNGCEDSIVGIPRKHMSSRKKY